MRFLWIMISMRQQIAAFQHADWSKTIWNLKSTTKLWSRTRHSLNLIENSENSKKKNSKFSKISNFSSKLKNFNVKFIFDLLLMNYNALILTWIRYCSWPFFCFLYVFSLAGFQRFVIMKGKMTHLCKWLIQAPKKLKIWISSNPYISSYQLEENDTETVQIRP